MTYEDYLTITNDGLDVESHNIQANCLTSKNDSFNLDSNGNMVVNSVTITGSRQLLTVDDVYPVGSIYMNIGTTDPALIFGGTWQKIKDTFLLGSGDTFSLGATGGEAEHVLTVNEMPSHSHNCNTVAWTNPTTDLNNGYIALRGVNRSNYAGQTDPTGSTGASQAHNNMPPYLVVNIWKRIS